MLCWVWRCLSYYYLYVYLRMENFHVISRLSAAITYLVFYAMSSLHRRRQSSIDFHSALTAAAGSDHATNLSPIVEKFPNAAISTPTRKILLAYDGTEDAAYTLEYLKSKLLKDGDHLFIAHVLPMPVDNGQTHESTLIQLKEQRDRVLAHLRDISNNLLKSSLHVRLLYCT